MRFIEIPALITEDIEDPSIVEITEPISASISGTTLTIDGGSKVSGEATVTLTGDTTVDTFTLQNIKQPSLHKISVKTNGTGNFTYVPNDDVTASSVSSTTKTGSDFEILLITTNGGETYVDFDLADYTSPAVNFSNALTGFDISELTSTYGATAKLYKPDGTLLTTVTSAKSGSGVNFGYTESTPGDVTYTLEVEDDLGRKSKYDLPRKWISYAMETNSTPGFEKLALAGNEYTSTTIVPNISPSSKVRVHKKNNHGYLGINFKIQGRNTTNGAWVDIDDTGENENDDESKEFLAFGDYLYHRVWVKPTAKASATVSSSNVVTLSLTDFTEENLDKSFENFDPYDIDEISNTYVFEETSKVGTIPFTLSIGGETYSNAFAVTTEEVGTVPNTDFSTSNAIFTYGTSGSNQSAMIFGSDDAKYLCVYNPSNGEEMFVYKGDPSTGSYALYGGTNGDGIYRHADYVADATPLEGSAMSWDGKYMLLKHYYWGDVTVYKNNETDSQYDKIINNLRSANYNVGSWGACQFIPNSYDFVMTMHANNNIYGFGVVYFENSGDTWTEKWTWENPTSGGLTRTTADAKWGRFGFQFSRDKKYAALTSYANPTNVAVLSVDLENQTFQKIWEEGISVGYACAMSPDGKYVIAGNQKIFKNNDAGDWTSKTEVQSEFTNNTIFTDYCIFLGDKYVAGGNTTSKHLFEFYPKKEVTLTYNDKDRITITKTGGLTTTTDKLYKDGVLYETLNSESMIFINETGVYQVISDDKYYSNKITVTTVSETESILRIGHRTCFLLRKDGKVMYWGESHNGSNGMGNTTETVNPTLHDNLNAIPGGIKHIGGNTGDSHAKCAISGNGKLYTWGYNGHGSLGRNNVSNYENQGPWLVDTQSSNTFTRCLSGYYTNFALQDNGYLWGCGYNGAYELADGSTTNRYQFVRLNIENVMDFCVTHHLGIAVTTNNTVYMWGNDNNSAMGGLGTRTTPTQLTTLDGKNIVKVRCSHQNGYAISSDGKLYAWGQGTYSMLPNGSTGNVGTPTEMTWFSRKNIRLVDLECGWHTNTVCLALDDQGNMYVWGQDGVGALGDEVDAPNNTHWPFLLKTNIETISVGHTECGCIDKFGQVYTWGNGTRGAQNWIHGVISDTHIYHPTSNNLSTGTTLIYDGYDTLKLGKNSSVTSTITYGSNTLSLDTKSDIFIKDPHTYTFKVSDTSSGTLTYLSNVASTVSRPTGRVYPPKSGTRKSLGSRSASANHKHTWTVDGAVYGNGGYTAYSSGSLNSANQSLFECFDGHINQTCFHSANGQHLTSVILEMPQKIKLTKYAIYSRSYTGEYTYAPRDWKVYGSNDGSDWTELDSRTNETVTAWGSQTDHRDTKREYTVTGNTKYFSQYKYSVSATNGSTYTVLSQIEYYGDEDEGFITYDGFGKVTVDTKGDTGATSNITYYSNTYEMGTARDLYITDTGTGVYGANIYGSSKAFLGTHTVSADTIDNVPGFTLAFHHGTFADSGDPYSDGSVTTAATNGHVFADTATGTYSWGTLAAQVKERENPDFTANSTLHTDYSSKYGWTTNSGWVASADSQYNNSEADYGAWKAFSKDQKFWQSNHSSGVTSSTPATLTIQYPSSQVIKSYKITSKYYDATNTNFPSVWKLQGYDGSSWVDIGSEQTITTWLPAETKRFDVSTNTTAYTKYQLKITTTIRSATDSTSNYAVIQNWSLYTVNNENDTVHDDYTKYTWTPPGTITADVLMVAGGGGAGHTRSGGGGAGGLLFHTSQSLSSDAKTIVVGNGGLGGGYAGTGGIEGLPGNETSFTGLTTVAGGGYGGGEAAGRTGGSSSGAGGRDTSAATAPSPPGQGNAGGTAGTDNFNGAGGGGAGGTGQNQNSRIGGVGVDYSSVFGTTYGDSGWFASGGTGSGESDSTTSAPLGGGGGGGYYGVNDPTSTTRWRGAQKHTGGGGGGCHYHLSNNNFGGSGGSGIVLIKKLGPVNPPALNFDGYNKLTIDNVAFSANEWPPTDGTVSSFTVTNSNRDAEWTISGASYGNGTYKSKWSANIIDANRHSGKAFNKIYGSNECFHANGTTAGNLDLEVPQAFILGSYDMRHRNNVNTNEGNAPRDWVISGSNDGSTWTVLDTQTSQVYSPDVPVGGDTLRSYTITDNTTAYKHYRMYISSIDGGGHIVIGELRYHEQPNTVISTIKKDDVAFATTTSNTIYIRDTGTYTAEVKGSGAYVTELSNVVSAVTKSPLNMTIMGYTHSVYATDTSGNFWVWGRNDHGYLGLSHGTDNQPGQINTNTDIGTLVFRKPGIIAGYNSAYVVVCNTIGECWGWGGTNSAYGPALGNNEGMGIPYKHVMPNDASTGVPVLITQCCGGGHALALGADSNVYSWGGNTYNQLGRSGTTT